MKTVLLLFCLCSVSLAQESPGLLVGVSPLDKSSVEGLFGSRSTGLLQVWLATVANFGAEPVVLTESAFLRPLLPLRPHGDEAAAILIDKLEREHPLSVIGRLIRDLSAGTVVIDAVCKAKAKDVEACLGVNVGLAVAGAVIVAPYLADRVAQEKTPIRRNFEAVRFPNSPVIPAHGSILLYVITAPQYKTARYQSFAIDGAGGGLRLAQ